MSTVNKLGWFSNTETNEAGVACPLKSCQSAHCVLAPDALSLPFSRVGPPSLELKSSLTPWRESFLSTGALLWVSGALLLSSPEEWELSGACPFVVLNSSAAEPDCIPRSVLDLGLPAPWESGKVVEMAVLRVRLMQLMASAFAVDLVSPMWPGLWTGLQVDRFLTSIPAKQLDYSICISCFMEVRASLLMGLPSEFPGNNFTILLIFERPIHNPSLKFSRITQGYFILFFCLFAF